MLLNFLQMLLDLCSNHLEFLLHNHVVLSAHN